MIRALTILALTLAACGEADVGDDAECSAAYHCELVGGVPTCEPGYRWQDPDDDANLKCVSSTAGPGGVKGIGEVNGMPSLPTVEAAIFDAYEDPITHVTTVHLVLSNFDRECENRSGGASSPDNHVFLDLTFDEVIVGANVEGTWFERDIQCGGGVCSSGGNGGTVTGRVDLLTPNTVAGGFSTDQSISGTFSAVPCDAL
jgi:hypothetical protein